MKPKMNTSSSQNCGGTIREFILHPEKCTACMSCILACSFHYGKRFDRKIASIKVSTSKKEREIYISIQKEESGEIKACDNCKGEREPLCVRYCVPKAIDYR